MYAQSIKPRSCREGRSAHEGPGVARPTSSTRMREARTSMASLLMLAEWALGAEQVRVPASTRRGTRMEVRVRKEASVCLAAGASGCAAGPCMFRPSPEPLSSSSFSLLVLLPLRTASRLASLRLGNAMDIEGEQARAQAQGQGGTKKRGWEADSMYVPQRVRARTKVDAKASISVLRLDELAALA